MIPNTAYKLTLYLVATALPAAAQTNPGPVVRAEPVIVEAAPADSAGATRVPFDPTAPAPAPTIGTLADRVANLHLDAGGAGSFGTIFTLRGLANTPYFSDPSITLYFDDLPLASSFTYPTGLFGFASATVYRGPQATAFGHGGEGGVIAFASAEPAARAAGELLVSAGNDDARSAAIEALSAGGGKADAAVSASFGERDGYISNTQLGVRVDDQESYSASVRLRLRPTPSGEFTLQVLGERTRDGAQPLVPLGGPLYSVARGREGETDIDFGGIALKGSFDTPFGRLTETTSYTDWRLTPYANRLVLPPTLDSRIDQSQGTWNEEIRLASGPHTGFAWNAGAWFSDGVTDGNVDRDIPGLYPIEVSDFDLKVRTAALFGQAVFTPAAGWRLTAGLRVEDTEKDFNRGQSVPGPGYFTGGASFEAFLPKLEADYDLSAETTATASVSFGTKPGGWSAYTGNANLAPFKAEDTIAFETGLETSFAKKAATLAARAFAYDIRDYQIERSFTATDYLVVNAPRALAIGGELESSWRPAPEWTLAASLGVTDLVLTEFTDPFTEISYAGRRAPYAPAYDAHASAVWHAPTGWFAGAELNATGRTFYDETENPRFEQPAYAVIDARAGFETARWRVSLYVENIADKGYYTLIIPGVLHGVPGAPRTWGVDAALKW